MKPMTQEKMEALADKYQTKADKAFDNYQQTGVTHYDRERRNNEDLAAALRIAANQTEEHAEYVHLKNKLSTIAVEARDRRNKPGSLRPLSLWRKIMASSMRG